MALAEHANLVPVRRTVLADGVTPVVALATLGAGPGSFLLESVAGGEHWGRYSFVGFDPALRVSGRGSRYERVDATGARTAVEGVDPFESLREEMRRFRPAVVEDLPRFWGGAVGYVAYDAVRRFEPTVGGEGDASLPEFSFAIGGTVLVFDDRQKTLTIVVPSLVEGDPHAAYARARERIEQVARALVEPARLPLLAPPDGTARAELPESSFDEPRYVAAVERIKEHIRAGDIFQAVLAQRFLLDATDVSPLDVYRSMRVLNPSPYMYFLRMDEACVAGASPETLVRLEGGRVELRPIAGTRPRGANTEEDEALERELLADPKERAEHVMLVDLGRNDIGRIAVPGSVRILERMVVERYSHVMHLVSDVIGQLAPGLDALDVLRATFPAGTLTGAPKVRAMQILDELEPCPRGLYGGAIGYLGFDGNMDVAIAIRTIVERDGQLTLAAGAGIVEASDPHAEYRETLHKARAALVAVEAGRHAGRAARRAKGEA
ncbi:MAG: anthranilate synthase component I [Myxococcales bacterium]|nr:anthranilate synthase component I [Myxococcales bacterium]